MNLDLQKDKKKMYIVVIDPYTKLKKEMELFLKQATQVLMYCHNDFRRFVGEILCIKHSRIALRDINKVIENLTNQNLRMQADYLVGQDMAEEQEEQMNTGTQVESSDAFYGQTQEAKEAQERADQMIKQMSQTHQKDDEDSAQRAMIKAAFDQADTHETANILISSSGPHNGTLSKEQTSEKN